MNRRSFFSRMAAAAAGAVLASSIEVMGFCDKISAPSICYPIKHVLWSAGKGCLDRVKIKEEIIMVPVEDTFHGRHFHKRYLEDPNALPEFNSYLLPGTTATLL